jgi:hypothetical protein
MRKSRAARAQQKLPFDHLLLSPGALPGARCYDKRAVAHWIGIDAYARTLRQQQARRQDALRDLSAKRVGRLHELVPQPSVLGALIDFRDAEFQFELVEEARRRLGRS